jgi:hypothetical protein
MGPICQKQHQAWRLFRLSGVSRMLHFYLISRRILSQDHGIIRPLLHESFLEHLRDPSGLIHVRSVFTYERISRTSVFTYERIHVRAYSRTSVFTYEAYLCVERICVRSTLIYGAHLYERIYVRNIYVYLEHT